MSKRVVCDICGEETHNFEKSLVVKRRWALWQEAGWDRLDVCRNCAEKMLEFIKNEQMRTERKHGTYRTSEYDDEWYCRYHICNECGTKWMCIETNFCPNCGADMRVKPNGEE